MEKFVSLLLALSLITSVLNINVVFADNKVEETAIDNKEFVLSDNVPSPMPTDEQSEVMTQNEETEQLEGTEETPMPTEEPASAKMLT